MNRFRPIVVLAALACTLAMATDALAEKRIYGQTQVAAGNTLRCAAEASLSLGAYLLYETGKPIEQTLPIAMTSAAAKADARETERRLRAVYAAKPVSPPAWGTQVFQQCLVNKAIPLDYTRSGNCYLLTFYLGAVVPLHQAQGMTNQQILAQVVPGSADAAFRTRVQVLVNEIVVRGNVDPRKNNVQDLGRFLQCVAPGQPAVSDS
jgi:hypothetical protein